jgi:hypothetical protein
MFKHLSILPAFAILLCSACDDSKSVRLPSDTSKATAEKDKNSEDPETRSVGKTSSDSTGSSSSSSTSKPSDTFETQLESLVTQKAPWGDIDISVEKARLLRGDKPAGFPSQATHSKSSVYAILDLKLQSNGDQENDYQKRDTWDLLLKDGARVKALNPVGVVLPSRATKTVRLFYKVADNAKLNGASLEINGSERDALEPLPIPLDEKSTFASQVELSELLGESFQSDSDSGLSYKIVDAVYGVNLEDTGRRAPRNERLVELTVRVSYDGDSDETSFDDDKDAPRLAFDDNVFAPDAIAVRTIQSGKSHDFALVYRIEEDTSYVDLVFDSGDFQDRWASDIVLPPLLERDRATRADQVDHSEDDASDEFDSSDQSFDDDADSDNSGDHSTDSSDDSGDDSEDDSQN